MGVFLAPRQNIKCLFLALPGEAFLFRSFKALRYSSVQRTGNIFFSYLSGFQPFSPLLVQFFTDFRVNPPGVGSRYPGRRGLPIHQSYLKN